MGAAGSGSWVPDSFTIFCSEMETNNIGHLDFTNNSGVQDPLLQAGSQATGRPVHFNPVLSTKRKWRLSTYHQPSCSKPGLGEGVLQDGGTASSEIPNTTGRLHDEIRPERCILRTSNSSLPQEVSEVRLSGQNIPSFSAFPLTCPQLCGHSQRH